MDLFADPDFVRDEMEAEPATRPPQLKLPPGMAFRAGRDGTGHLLTRGALRYLCGGMPIAERFAWPVLELCQPCVARLTEGGR